MSQMTNSTNNAEATDWDELFVRAANKKDYRAMEEALALGADINVVNVRGITPLHAAVMSRSLDMVAWLSKRGASPSLKTTAGDTALHDASKLDEPDYLRELLSSGRVDVNVVNSLGSSPLMEAASAKRAANVKRLVDEGALVNHKSKLGSSALLIAAGKHDHETVKLLLSKGANSNDVDSYGVSALISAAAVMARFDAGGDESPEIASQRTMAELIRCGANVNLVAKSGNTALAEAARCMNKRGMLLLIDANANPNVHSTAGVSGEMTPLMIASYKHDAELIKKLIERKADVNYANQKGQSAIMMAMMAPIQNEKQQAQARATIETLLKAGATLAQDKDSRIGLAHYGVLTESKELLAIAKEQGVLEQKGESGATAIFYAIAMRKGEILKELKVLGADFCAKNEDGQSVLHILAAAPYPPQIVQAIEMMRKKNDEKLRAEAIKLESQTKASALDFTKMLVDFGANLNGRDGAGNTPLHAALSSMAFGRVDRAYIDFMVEMGSDVSIRNDVEDSPFIMAIKMGNLELAEEWAKKLIASGDAESVKRAIYDVSWAAPEHESQVQAMKVVFNGLKKHGADVSYQDDDGQFPLLIAASTNQEDLVNALIEMGADVNQRNQEGEIAAFHSIKENHPNITRILFDKGCNPDAVRNDGESLITIAYRDQNSTAVQQIIECRKTWQGALDGVTDMAGSSGDVVLDPAAVSAPKKMGM